MFFCHCRKQEDANNLLDKVEVATDGAVVELDEDEDLEGELIFGKSSGGVVTILDEVGDVEEEDEGSRDHESDIIGTAEVYVANSQKNKKKEI